MTRTKRLALTASGFAILGAACWMARGHALSLSGEQESLAAVERCFASAFRPFLRRAVAMIVQLRQQVAATQTQAGLWPRQAWPGRQAAI